MSSSYPAHDLSVAEFFCAVDLFFVCVKWLALVGRFSRGVETFMVAWHNEEKKANRLRATKPDRRLKRHKVNKRRKISVPSQQQQRQIADVTF